MSDTMDLSTLTEAKNIYTHNLCKILQPQIYKGFISILNLCKGSNETLKNFQRKVEGIPKWNSMIIDDEYNRIIQETKCEYLDDLLNAVFIANSKILSVINNDKRTIDITVPNPKKFLHACYIACAYNFFMDPFLFDDSHEDYRKRQRNMREIFEIINKCIIETVENLLPIEDLLRNCLKKNIPEDNSDSEKDIDSFEHLKEDFGITEQEEKKIPSLDILEGRNLYDAHKNYSKTEIFTNSVNDKKQQNEEYNENKNDYSSSEDEEEKKEEYNKETDDKTGGHLLVSEEQMKRLDKEKIIEQDEDSDTEEEDQVLSISNNKIELKPSEDFEKSTSDENKPKKVYFFDDI